MRALAMSFMLAICLSCAAIATFAAGRNPPHGVANIEAVIPEGFTVDLKTYCEAFGFYGSPLSREVVVNGAMEQRWVCYLNGVRTGTYTIGAVSYTSGTTASWTGAVVEGTPGYPNIYTVFME